MIDCADIAAKTADSHGDPRLDERYVRCLPADGAGTLLLVGVVHDHPASVFRAVDLVRASDPETLAVELPPLATGLFRLYARDEFTPPRLGGEMSAAIQAGGDARTVGIDAPNRRYLRRLVERLLNDAVSTDVVTRAARDALYGYAHAFACRLGSLVGSVTPLRPQVYDHLSYGTTSLDAPATQAADERSHLSQRQVFLDAVETPPAVRLIDAVRDATMAERLSELRTDGDLVAIVGMEHLDPLEAALSDSE